MHWTDGYVVLAAINNQFKVRRPPCLCWAQEGATKRRRPTDRRRRQAGANQVARTVRSQRRKPQSRDEAPGFGQLSAKLSLSVDPFQKTVIFCRLRSAVGPMTTMQRDQGEDPRGEASSERAADGEALSAAVGDRSDDQQRKTLTVADEG